jgi:hypothetical protein
LTRRSSRTADVVSPDYYATLQVARSSESAVIRAAYLALMRRYHPDNNPSEHAAARARAINSAYDVLSDPEKRARYDHARAREEWDEEPSAPRWKGLPMTIAAVGGLVLLFILPTMIDWSPLSTAQQHDRLSNAPRRATATAANTDPSQRCASQAAFDVVKRQVFRDAARVRGSDGSAFERIAAYTVMRVEKPRLTGQDPGSGTVDCMATVALDLPPGVAIGGTRGNVTGDVGYSLVEKEPGRAVLADGGAIIAALATLARTAPPPPVPAAPVMAAVVQPPPAQPVEIHRQSEPARLVVPAPMIQPKVALRPLPAATTIVSVPVAKAMVPKSKGGFSCHFTNVPGDVSTCKSPELNALDGRMVALYSQSLRAGSEPKRASLVRTRDQFLARRNACRTDACVSKAYLARMREISDIMIGG